MKKVLKITYIFFIIIILMLFGIASISQKFNIDKMFSIIYFLFLSLSIGLYSILTKNHKILKILFIMYFILLISLTIFDGRAGFGLIDKEYFLYYIKHINLIPLKSIIEYTIINFSIKNFSYNILGNLFIFIPLTFLIKITWKKISTKKMLLILIICTFFIEISQLLFCAGRFDIDDFILNISGGIIFNYALNKLNIIHKISVLFNKTKSLKNIIKVIMFILVNLVIILLNIYFIINMYQVYKTPNNNSLDEKIYILEIDDCQEKQYQLPNYLISSNCIELYYENKYGEQMMLHEAFEQNYILNIDHFEQIIGKNHFEYDDNMNRYIKNNIKISIENISNENYKISISSK